MWWSLCSGFDGHFSPESGGQFDRFFHNKTKNGKIINIEGSANPVFDDSGDIIGFLAVQRDITERKQAEVALQESEEKYRNIFENVQDVFYQTDLNGNVLEISPSIKYFSEFNRDEIIGKPVSDLYYNPDDRDILLKTIMKSGELKDYEIRLKTKKDVIKYASVNARLIFDANGNPSHIDGAIRDITERKKAELNLINALEKVTESDRLKSAFLANMSHEIRTPMNGILGFSDLLKEPNLSGEEQKKYIEIIEKSGARMLNIINDIIDISKIESGQMKLSMSETSVNDKLEYIYSFFKPEVEKKGLKFSLKNKLLAKEATIITDPDKFLAILINLVKNAIKYTNEGTIEFGCENKGKYLEGFVKDTGIGIPKDRQEAIFERFIQAEIEDKMARQGAGLGLAISKSYVELLGGKIWVVSKEGNGASFHFTIPYSSETDDKKTINHDVTKGMVENQTKNLRILIAEDDETSEMLMTIEINAISKEILIARTGIEAVEVCRNNPDIDLILMDIQMPKMNGYKATQQIREFNKDVVIIAQTAFGLSRDREKAIESGCNDYISKPINKVELMTLITKVY